MHNNAVDRKFDQVWEQFSRSNSLLNRVKMNIAGGGHSDLTAFGDFIRNQGAEKLGQEALDWAAKHAPEVSGATRAIGFGEFGIDYITIGYDLSQN